MKNGEVLKLVKTVNDVALGAPITSDMLDDLKQWVRLEEEHGASPSATAIVKALIREVEDARSTQTTTATAAPKRKKAEVPVEEPAQEDPPVEDGEPEDEPVLAGVAAEGGDEKPVEAPEEW